MKKTVMGLLAFTLFISITSADAPKALKHSDKALKSTYVFPIEGDAIEYNVNQLPRPSAINYPNSRDLDISSALVDSSRNGYGMLLGATNPLHWEPNYGFTWCFRQWYIANETVSGQLGASFSSNGVEGTWDIYSGLNLSSPGETLARYPSAVGGSDYPYLVWNEYTTGSGGGDYGGRPLYTWDQFYYGGGSYFSPPLDINNGCQSTPCDPADNWVACPVITNDASGTPVLNVTYSGWSGSSSNSLASVRYIYRSNFHQAGYFAFNDAVELYTGEEFEAETGTGSYTSSAIIDINEDGVGYSAVISYFDGVVTEGETPADTAHTFMLRKTEDNGATWSETGHNGTPFYYIPSEWLNTYFDDNDLFPEYYVASDTDSTEITEAYIPYDFELKVDSDGTLHIFAPVIPSGGGFIYWIEGCGMYHMWNDDPVNDPMGWEASYMGPMDITYMYGYASSNYFRIFPSSAISIENSDIMYSTWEAYSDTSANRFNFDVFAVRSEDGGATWTEPMNITNTLMLDVDEIHPHLAPRATDEECYIVYMAPDYEVETVTPAASPEDFKQRLWFANLNWGEVSIESGENLPVRFELSQNFPNPFNPQTVISYSLDRTADVRLEVFDLLGRKVQTLVNKEMDAGNHDVVWKGSEQGAGIYFYRLSTDGRSETRKMVLLK